MKVIVEEHDGSMWINLEAENMQEASLIVRMKNIRKAGHKCDVALRDQVIAEKDRQIQQLQAEVERLNARIAKFEADIKNWRSVTAISEMQSEIIARLEAESHWYTIDTIPHGLYVDVWAVLKRDNRFGQRIAGVCRTDDNSCGWVGDCDLIVSEQYTPTHWRPVPKRP